MNFLFICSRNQWRSPTAEAIYKDNHGVNVRSAGTEPSARIKLSAKTILWADIIFVMEKKHKQRMIDKFPIEVEDKMIIILDIPDEYQFMDPELIEDIKTKVDLYLQ
ncbi:MAG: protein tyrosine phosphatase [Bacteroidetes bacterium]|nr:protein tyrosine phosphatase [Bacteroidota bacterium]